MSDANPVPLDQGRKASPDHAPKVVIVTNYWKGQDGGGVKAYLNYLVKELKRQGVDLSVVFKEGEDDENYAIRGTRFLFPLKAFFKLRTLRPQTVHTHGSWFALLSGYLYKGFYGGRLIHTFHTDPNRPSYLEKRTLSLLTRKCDAVTFVSKGLKERVEQLYGLPETNAVITYPGVAPRVISEIQVQAFRQRYGIRPDNTVLLGQSLTDYRTKADGVKSLVQAVELLRSDHPDILLVLTREGQYTNELRDYAAAQGMTGQVRFTGDLEEPYVAVQVCDLLTHITYGDGLPLSILEAMSMGKPVIASSVGGIPEIIEDGKNGILVTNEPSNIAEAIDRLLRDRALAAELGRRGKETVESKNRWETTARTFIALYFDQDLTKGTKR